MCAPLIDASNSWPLSGMWQRGAGAVVRLRSGRVIRAGRPVDVVMARAAGRAAGLVSQHADLRRLRVGVGPLVAVRAVANVLREADGGEIVDRLAEADDLVRRPGHDAREVRAVVDLVDHHLEVDGVAAVGIGGLRLVAYGRRASRPGARRRVRESGSWQLLQLAAWLILSHLSVTRLPVRPEVVFDVGVVVLARSAGEVARGVDAEGVGLGLVEARRQHRAEGVRRVAGLEVGELVARAQ